MKTLLGSALLAVTLGGCGSEARVMPPPPPPHSAGPPVMVAMSGNANMQRGSSAQLIVTVVRSVSSIGPVDLGIAGLGVGITATFEPTPVPESATTSTLTLSAGAAASVGARMATVCAQAPGGGGSCAQFLVTIAP